MTMLLDKKFIDQIRKNKSSIATYINYDLEDENVAAIICYSVNYDDEGGYIYGAYYGGCGGGETDGGFFTVDCPEGLSTHYDYGMLEKLSKPNPQLKEVLELMMSHVWEMIDEDDGRLHLTNNGQAEFDKYSEDDICMLNDFDGDLLCEISEKWTIPIRFED